MKLIFSKYKILFTILTIVLTVSSIFMSGFYSNDARFEQIANYASLVAENQSDGGIFSISVENKKTKGNLLPPDSELYSLYGIFKQEKITFASTINATKKDHTIFLENGLSSNLSFLYLGPTGTIEYNNHYKHYVFPVELMFKDNQSKAYQISDYICYLSKSQATRILNRMNGFESDNYTDEDYERLLYTPISFDIDGGNIFTFSIINIYFEDNYYYSGLNSVMGEFVMCSYYLPLNLRQDQKSLYFMSKYSYQNRYFMNYINQVYPSDDYRVSVNPFNINGQFDNDLIISFRNSENKGEAASYIFVSISIIFTIFFPFFYVANKGAINPLLILSSCFGSYYIFKLINFFSKNTLWFSSFSTRLFLFYVIGLSLFMIIFKVIFLTRKKRTNVKQNKTLYEINI